MRGTVTNLNLDVEIVLEECCSCGVVFGMTKQTKQHYLKYKAEMFYCPNGHSQHYVGKSDAEKLKEAEAARVAAEARAKLAENAAGVERKRAEDEREKAKKARAKLNRVAKGVCPECKRSFSDLARHMHVKHDGKVHA